MLSNSYPRTWLGHTLELGSCWEHGPGMTQGSEGCASLVWQSLGLGWCCPEPGVLCMRYLVCQCRNSPSAGILPPSVCVCLLFSRFQSAACSPVWESLSFHPKAATMWQRTISTLSGHWLNAGPSARRSSAGLRLHSQTPLALKRNRFTPSGGLVFCEGAAGVAQHGELSWEEPVHFPVNKNSSGFVILRYLSLQL